MKKIKISSELVYFIALFLIAFSVAMISCTNYGVSMIVAPAYILSLKFPNVLSFGLAEYVVQGILMIAFCILVRRVKLVYFSSFLTCLIYGAVLDLLRLIIPVFNPQVTEPGSLSLYANLFLFLVGNLITTLSVAMFFRTYLYSQVYDFFVKGVSQYYGISTNKFKVFFDFSSLGVSLILSLVLFLNIKGVGLGTIVIACFNGALITAWGKFIDKYFDIAPTFKRFSRIFDIS